MHYVGIVTYTLDIIAALKRPLFLIFSIMPVDDCINKNVATISHFYLWFINVRNGMPQTNYRTFITSFKLYTDAVNLHNAIR